MNYILKRGSVGFAEAYINEGAKVCIADINIDQAQKSAAGLGDNAISVHLDVTKQTSIDAAVQKTISEFGTILNESKNVVSELSIICCFLKFVVFCDTAT